MAEERLTAAQRSRIRRLSAYKDPEPGEDGGELNIVPFLDIIVNVMIFVLATVTVTFTASIESTPPSLGGAGKVRAQETKTLNLSVFIVHDGFSLKASGGNVAPGCSSPGAGLAVPKQGEAYDFAGLKTCAKRLKEASPDFQEETQVTITANPSVDYQTIIHAMDALRTSDEGEDLFPEVHFGVPR